MPRTFVSLFGSGGDVLPSAGGGGITAPVLLESTFSETSSQTYNTGSVTLANGVVHTIDVTNEHFSGAQADTVSITGWTSEKTTVYGPSAGSLQRQTRLWRVGDGSTGALTINVAGGSGNKQCAWAIVKHPGVDASTPFAQASVSNNSDGVGAPNNLLLTLPSLIDAANNAIFAGFGTEGSAVTQDTGYTQLSDSGTSGTTETRIETQYKLAAQTTCQSTDIAAFEDIGGIISEMKKA